MLVPHSNMRETDPSISKTDRLHHEGNTSSPRERDAAVLSKDELESLPPEDYLRLTGVSTAVETAFALVASLRPRSPLKLFTEMCVAVMCPVGSFKSRCPSESPPLSSHKLSSLGNHGLAREEEFGIYPSSNVSMTLRISSVNRST